MRKLLRIIGCTMILFGINFSSVPQSRAEETLEDWPARILSLAYILRNGSTALEKIEAAGPDREFLGQELDGKFKEIYTLLSSAETKSLPHRMLIWLGHHCWVKNDPGFSCGDPQARKFNDSGFLYVTDPVPLDNDFIILILSGVSPAHTIILKLYRNKAELVYDSFDEGNSHCDFTDTVPLGVVYGLNTIGYRSYMLSESNNRFSEDSRRHILLDLSKTECHLVQHFLAPAQRNQEIPE